MNARHFELAVMLMIGFVTCRLKEQLIKELVATGRGAQMMNKQYQEKIRSLEMVRLVIYTSFHFEKHLGHFNISYCSFI